MGVVIVKNAVAWPGLHALLAFARYALSLRFAMKRITSGFKAGPAVSLMPFEETLRGEAKAALGWACCRGEMELGFKALAKRDGMDVKTPA